MLTDDEKAGLNELSARIAALETMMAWLLCDHLKRSRDPELADLLIQQAMPPAALETTEGQAGFIKLYGQRVELLVRQAEMLLHAGG